MKRSKVSLIAGVLFAAAFLSGRGLLAQDLQWERGGSFSFEEMGYSVAGVVDLDGDSRRDVLVGAPDALFGATGGSVFLLSGSDGSVLGQLQGVSAGDCLGVAVEQVGDVDSDGVVDFAIGASQKPLRLPAVGPGIVYVFSGVDQSLLHTFGGSTNADRFGTSVAGADLDGDGFSDIVVGAPGDFQSPGSVTAYSGANGSLLYTWIGDSNDDRFGISVTVLDDVDQDGRPDVAVGAPQRGFDFRGSGYVRVFSGATGATIYSVLGDAAGDEFGRSVDGGADIDGDNLSDLAVGAPQFNDLCSPPGYARLLSGTDGSTLRTFDGERSSDFFGLAVCLGDDANGDGEADLLVGAPQPFTDCGTGGGPGYVRLFSVRTGNELYTFVGETPLDWDTGSSGQFGFAVDLVPDMDGDGFAEVLAGGIFEEQAGVKGGQVQLFQGNDLYLQAKFRFSGDLRLSLTTAEGPTGNPVLLSLTSINGAPTFLVIGGVGFFGPDEVRVLSGVVPPSLSGNTLGFLALALDVSGKIVLSAEERVRFE